MQALLGRLHVKVSNHMAVLDEQVIAKVKTAVKPAPKTPVARVKAAVKPKRVENPVRPEQAVRPSIKAQDERRVEGPPPKPPVAKPAPPKPAPAPILPAAKPAAPVARPAPPPPHHLQVVGPTPPSVVPPKPEVPLKPTPPVSKPAEPVSKPIAPSALPKPVVEPPPVSQPSPVSTAAAVATAPPALKPLSVPVPLTVKELADKLSVSPSEIIKRLLGMKILATMNQLVTEEPVTTLLKTYGYEYQHTPTLEEQIEASRSVEDRSRMVPRPPVVTLMGHVDHGKTSLLDAIRKTKVVEGEAGGITQHIGAYRVMLPKGTITFLDTPGHEAFTAMRARGAHVTDIVILVVAADDGVMPQTVEAVDHSKAAEATIVVALNKIDKPSADPDRVKKQLMEHNLMSEEWGGKTIVVPISAKTGAGIDHLLEMILLEAELLELKADPTRPAVGIVLEAKLSKGGGPVAHILVQAGTLRVGDTIVSGPYWGRARAMLDERGHRLQEAGPSTPVELLGLNGVPKAGDSFLVVPDERQAREVVSRRQESVQGPAPVKRAITLEEFHRQLEQGRVKGLNLILKADVQGSLEALKDSLEKLLTEEVSLKFLHLGVGDVTEPDVLLAEASEAVVIAFHVGMTPEAELLAKQEQVDVRLYQIIYEAVADIRAALEGLLEPRTVEQTLGRAKVLQVFKVSKAGTIAGCQVAKGKIVRGAVARVFRGQERLFQGKINSLKRFKDDAREVTEGLQCGIGLAGFNDFQPDDIIEAIEVSQVAAKL